MQLVIDETLDKKSFAANVKEIYNKVYREYDYRPIESLGSWLATIKLYPKFREALDVGCGLGQGIWAMRSVYRKVFGCDIANLREHWIKAGIDQYCTVAPAHKMPYKTGRFDLVVCSDVLEHIPEKLMDDTFREICRVGGENYLFNICNRDDICPGNLREKGIAKLHITIKPESWWEEKVESNGMAIIAKATYGGDPGVFTLKAIKVKEREAA